MHAHIPSYTNKDRILGYYLLFAAFLVCSIIAVFCIQSICHPYPVRIIAFSEIGNLKPDDPVYLKGLSVGTIRNIVWHPKQVLVYVTIRRPIVLYSGYRIKNLEISSTGDRILMIEDGVVHSPEIAQYDTLKGIFYPGISEAIGLTGKLRTTINSLTAVSKELRNGTTGKPSLIFRTRAALHMLDSISLSLHQTLGTARITVLPALDSMQHVLINMATISNQASVTVPEYLATADTCLRIVNHSLQWINDLTDTLLMLTAAMQKHPLMMDSVAGKIPLEKITALDTVLNYINSRLLQIKVNLKLW